MKILKIIIIILIFLSPAQANTIYNILKIPNLEIYKIDDSNGLKYLRATKPFQVGVRNDNVTCFNSDIKNIEKKFQLIQKNLNIYQSNLPCLHQAFSDFLTSIISGSLLHTPGLCWISKTYLSEPIFRAALSPPPLSWLSYY